MKKQNALFTMMAMTASMSAGDSYPSSYTKKARDFEQERTDRKIKSGLKSFYFGENVVIALNQKSADKKALKKGWEK